MQQKLELNSIIKCKLNKKSTSTMPEIDKPNFLDNKNPDTVQSN